MKVGAVTTYYGKRVLRSVSTPFMVAGRFVVRVVGVPMYRGVFLIRRLTGRLHIPGKHKVMYLLTNRYAIHGIVIVIAFATGAMSVQAETLRSEDFGQTSILYQLVTGSEAELVEIVSADAVVGKPTRYLGSTAVSVQPDIDFHTTDDDYVALTSGGTALLAQTITDAAVSVAERSETIEYIVQTGDTISTIAERHGISITTLLGSNGLSVRSLIRPGDQLDILPIDGLTHTVKSGDTVLAIARKYSADADEIVSFNRMADSGDLRIGETLVIPGGTQSVPTRTRSIANVFKTTPQSTPSNIGSVTGSGSMIWPTDLRVITQYFGWRHTGLDVDCGYNNDNYAADDGIVQFVGWKGGYGLTVEVNHGNGIVTRYAHGARNYVANGQSVTQGQPVQLCGTTGRSTGTHIHFEVIQNGKFKNPLEYIR